MNERERFQRFADRLADAVLVHINTPGKPLIGFEAPSVCPLGTVSGCRGRPTGGWAAEPHGINSDDAWQFIYAFQGASALNESNPYVQLGRRYRARFL